MSSTIDLNPTVTRILTDFLGVLYLNPFFGDHEISSWFGNVECVVTSGGFGHSCQDQVSLTFLHSCGSDKNAGGRQQLPWKIRYLTWFQPRCFQLLQQPWWLILLSLGKRALSGNFQAQMHLKIFTYAGTSGAKEPRSQVPQDQSGSESQTLAHLPPSDVTENSSEAATASRSDPSPAATANPPVAVKRGDYPFRRGECVFGCCLVSVASNGSSRQIWCWEIFSLFLRRSLVQRVIGSVTESHSIAGKCSKTRRISL